MFGNILKKKRILLSRIGGIHRCPGKYGSQKLVDLEKELRAELEVVLDNEESLWKQKSQKGWLTLGDKNARYFHSQVNKWWRFNHITALKLDDGLWCVDEAKIKMEVVIFFW